MRKRHIVLCVAGCGTRLLRDKNCGRGSLHCQDCERVKYEEVFYRVFHLPVQGPVKEALAGMLYGNEA